MFFLKGRLHKYFFQEICFSGSKQTMHKVSAASIGTFSESNFKNFTSFESVSLTDFKADS